MWADIIITNKEAIINSLDQFNTSIKNLLKNTESIEDLNPVFMKLKNLKKINFEYF